LSDLSIEGKTILKRMLKKRGVCGVVSAGSGKGTVVGDYEVNNNTAFLCRAYY
jgi:hypothetical protein